MMRFLSAIRKLLGMPDYRGYVDHVRQCHPDREVPSEREFYEQYLARRYGTEVTRCC
jgi:uncharacterized short protein YbdD (DUF466 family)